jgi:hypothetical protein
MADLTVVDSQPLPLSVVSSAPLPPPAGASTSERFANMGAGAVDALKGIPGGIITTLKNTWSPPPGTAYTGPQPDQTVLSKADQAEKEGRPGEALVRRVLAHLPFGSDLDNIAYGSQEDADRSVGSLGANALIGKFGPSVAEGAPGAVRSGIDFMKQPGTKQILKGGAKIAGGIKLATMGGPEGLAGGAYTASGGYDDILKGLQKRAAGREAARAAVPPPDAPPPAPGTMTIQPQAAGPVQPVAPITAANYAPPAASTNVLPSPAPQAAAPTGFTMQPQAAGPVQPVAPIAPANYAPPVASTNVLPTPPAPAAAAPPVAAPSPAVSTDLLNQTARNMGARSFNSLAPPVQDAVRAAVARYSERASAGEETLARPASTPQASPVAQPSPTVTTIPQSTPDAPAQVFEDAARAKKTGPVARLLFDHGVPHADAIGMDDAQWGQVAKAAGVNPLSKLSQADALFQLRKLEMTPKPSAALLDALKKPGALAAAKAFAESQGLPQ